ncbi:uncharacterized protein LOC122662846 [Telopea speciosissima]|uniref:uncharacterized protein LOC122662846 n=1 Tax=Telopea speciosissima TaxID=54955 RepID=UPI001CC47989|nr:uncharacterized protein LOC122662846 [Telopea speciosissima]
MAMCAEHLPEDQRDELTERCGRPVEDLIPFSLSDEDPIKTVQLGSLLSEEQKNQLGNVLKANADVFACSAIDMPGISRHITEHRLHVDPSQKLIQQKRRNYTLDRQAAIKEELEKLQRSGFIREEKFPTWLANVVMVPKSNGKWRINMEVYVDDMLVKSLKAEHHLADLEEAFGVLRKNQMKLNPTKCAFGVTSGKFLGFMVSIQGIEANPTKIKAIQEMSPPRTI